MPKAAVITHLRFMFMVSGVFKIFGLSNDEIVYNTLPLYHTGIYLPITIINLINVKQLFV